MFVSIFASLQFVCIWFSLLSWYNVIQSIWTYEAFARQNQFLQNSLKPGVFVNKFRDSFNVLLSWHLSCHTNICNTMIQKKISVPKYSDNTFKHTSQKWLYMVIETCGYGRGLEGTGLMWVDPWSFIFEFTRGNFEKFKF